MARKVNASDAREFCNERPTKKRKSWLPARITFAQRKTWKRTSAGFVPKPLRNCSPKNLETLLLEPTKKTVGTHKKQSFGNRCMQAAFKKSMRPMPLAKRFRQAHTAKEVPWRGAIVKYPTARPQSQIVPKPYETARQTFAQRKTWKPASHQAKLKKKVFGTRMRKGRTPAGFVQAIAKPQPEKCRNVAVGTH